jgi:hypothetical protein
VTPAQALSLDQSPNERPIGRRSLKGSATNLKALLLALRQGHQRALGIDKLLDPALQVHHDRDRLAVTIPDNDGRNIFDHARNRHDGDVATEDRRDLRALPACVGGIGRCATVTTASERDGSWWTDPWPRHLARPRAYTLTRSPDAADLSMAAMTSWRRTASAKSGTV